MCASLAASASPKQVPWKARQKVAAGGLGAEEGEGEGKEPRIAPPPHRRSQDRRRRRRKARAPRTRPATAKGIKARVALGVDIECVADPIDAARKKPKPKAQPMKAALRSAYAERDERFLGFAFPEANRVQHPDQGGECDKHDGPKEEWRHRKDGKRTGQKGDKCQFPGIKPGYELGQCVHFLL